MLLQRAIALVELGHARIINDRVRMLDPTDAGYERAPGFVRWGGSQSGYAGPTVMQAHRRTAGRRGV